MNGVQDDDFKKVNVSYSGSTYFDSAYSDESGTGIEFYH